MDVYKKIEAVLAPLKIHVKPFFVSGSKDPCVVVHQLTNYPAQTTDDAERITGYLLQIDFVSKKDIQALVDQGTRLLVANGFARRSRYDEYEPTSDTYRFCVRVAYFEEVE